MPTWPENKALLLSKDQQITDALAAAHRALGDKPHFFNPKDTLFRHSLRVASRIQELVANPVKRNLLAASSLYLEIPFATGQSVHEFYPLLSQEIFLPLWIYNLGLKEYPTGPALEKIMQRRKALLPNSSTGFEQQADVLLVISANEVDHLNTQLDFHTDSPEKFLEQLPPGILEQLNAHDIWLAEASSFAGSARPSLKAIVSDYQERLAAFKNLVMDELI